jgi:hypothetical protein
VTDGGVATCGGATSRAPEAVADLRRVWRSVAPLLLQSGSVLILSFFADQSPSFPFKGLRRVWCPLCFCGWHLGRGLFRVVDCNMRSSRHSCSCLEWSGVCQWLTYLWVELYGGVFALLGLYKNSLFLSMH